MRISLSKSQFLRGMQCNKSLWLYKNRPELRSAPDDFQKSVLETGTEVGIKARKLFPGGKVILSDGPSTQQKVQQTQELIDGGTRTVYEATFLFDDILVMIDILHRGDNGWELYEVKASTGLKEVYFNDLSVQYYVLKGLGLPVSEVFLVYLNKNYVRRGEIDFTELFRIDRVTDQVLEQQDSVRDSLTGIRSMLQGDCPDTDIGAYCTSPYECDFRDHCWADVPENSVFELKNRGIDKVDFYRRGLRTFSDLDLNDLNFKQRMQVETELSGKPVIVRTAINDFLNSLSYPMFFLDFETFMPPVPLYEETGPYQPIPFQYSLHMLEHDGADLKHYEFLAEAGTDPREQIIKDLTGLIPPDACTVSYNSAYEKMIIKQLSKQFPQYHDRLMELRNTIVDLMVPFRKRHYYTKEMKGSCSIKYVLPALVPDLSYKGMAVSGGGEAMYVYSRLHLISDREELEHAKKDLLEYCRLDTLGMVKILEKLRAAC